MSQKTGEPWHSIPSKDDNLPTSLQQAHQVHASCGLMLLLTQAIDEIAGNTNFDQRVVNFAGSIYSLVGGFNPFEKYESNWITSPSRGENKKSLKPPTSSEFQFSEGVHQKLNGTDSQRTPKEVTIEL